MTAPRRLPAWAGVALGAAGLGALYASALTTGFLNDDYLFLEATRRPLTEALTSLGPLGNYFRPLSRQLYFEALAPLARGEPLVFHLVNATLLAGALFLLADLLRVFLPAAGVMAGLLYFAVLPLQRVNLTWVSCSQDLLALLFSLAAFAAYRRGRRGAAAIAYAAAILSKESALPLPLLLAMWGARIENPSLPAVRRLWPFGAIVLAWCAVTIWIRGRHAAAAPLDFDPGHLLAGAVHGIQSLLGLEHPTGMFSALARSGPDPLALLFLGALAFWLPAPTAETSGPPGPNPIPFAALWLAAHFLVTGPVASTWSAYYYTLAAVGAALLFGTLFSSLRPLTWVGLTAGLLWWHAGSSGTRAFGVVDHPWGWTSHLTSFYFQRGAALTDTLSRQLRRLEPSPPPHTRFFFATLPPWAGFQIGNGALIRSLYRDSTLQSHFYSEFSESTAGFRPYRVLYWDGRALAPLYDRAHDPLFQIGSDLLLFDRPRGAAHAFRRGLAAGEESSDHLYWLGWTRLWLGDRRGAERAWLSYGARDDSASWHFALFAARQMLLERRDTLQTKRWLHQAILSGIGRPEAHAALGELLVRERPKYGMLELKVVANLKPNDWLARRELFAALVRARLDGPARRELEALRRVHPTWEKDTVVVEATRALEARSPGRSMAVELDSP